MRPIIIALLAAALTSCTLYERVETEAIYPPTIETEVVTPDWDITTPQQ